MHTMWLTCKGKFNDGHTQGKKIYNLAAAKQLWHMQSVLWRHWPPLKLRRFLTGTVLIRLNRSCHIATRIALTFRSKKSREISLHVQNTPPFVYWYAPAQSVYTRTAQLFFMVGRVWSFSHWGLPYPIKSTLLWLIVVSWKKAFNCFLVFSFFSFLVTSCEWNMDGRNLLE